MAWLPEAYVEEDLQSGQLCRAGGENWDIHFDIRLYYHHAARSERELMVQETAQEMAAAHRNAHLTL